MTKNKPSNFNFINVVAPVIITSYFLIGFIPNWQAVDRIAPQWLFMSIINLISISLFVYEQKALSKTISLCLNSKLSLTYILFILWALFSVFYAINPTEVIVNVSRQFNVLLMFISMVILLFSINNFNYLFWIISIFLSVEIYAVLIDAFNLININGRIDGGQLKGVTANRNITAFSLALKIPFVLFLIHISKNSFIKFGLSTIIFLAALCLTMIQSRASFIALGFISLFYIIIQIFLFKEENKRFKRLFQIGFLVFPIIFAVLTNQFFLADKGADVIRRASTISIQTEDDSIKQRLRYYEDVVTHITSNPFIGVGIGNWKLKSIDYDSKDIRGYVVPYHAHSDFIQIGAELGIIGFLLYLGIFIWAIFYIYKLLRFSKLNRNNKILILFTLTSLVVYTIDANLNFPIARPQVLVIWTFLLGLITVFYQKNNSKSINFDSNKVIKNSFFGFALIFLLPTIYINNQVYTSLKGQMILLQDFNSNQFNLPINQVDNVVPDIPNITVTTIPINSVKARYYVNAKKYDKALDLLEKGTKANPYLFYSEILKSQIFQEKGLLDSAKVYARKAFFGLPNNDLHATRYINLINLTRDREALEEAFPLLTEKNNLNNWKNYLIIASGLYPPKEKNLVERAKLASELFPGNEEFKALYRQIAIGEVGVSNAASFSAMGLKYFNLQDYSNAAKEFEKALKANPLDYAHFENAATANYLIGNLEKALEQIDVVINQLNPLNGKCEFIKALIFIRMGDPVGACPLLATARDSGYSQAEATFDQYCR